MLKPNRFSIFWPFYKLLWTYLDCDSIPFSTFSYTTQSYYTYRKYKRINFFTFRLVGGWWVGHPINYFVAERGG